MIYPWQIECWRNILARFERMPHALLLAGPQGGGKMAFAETLAARMLCERAAEQSMACGACPSCTWFAAGNHPDFRLIVPDVDEPEGTELDQAQPKKKSDQIRIHQIRALDDFLAVGTHRHGARVIIISPTESMNLPTANALLKMLEEPSITTLFMLVTYNKKRLLPTILSRCQTIDFPKPTIREGMDWLRQNGPQHAEQLLAHAGGMPLAAIDEAENWMLLEEFFRDLTLIERIGAMSIAARWESWLKEGKEGKKALDRRTLVIWMQKWLFDLLMVKSGGIAVFHSHWMKEIQAVSGRASLTELMDCYNDFLKIKGIAQHPMNPRLFLEDMLTRYARAALSG
jgi:DNA polymerase-3 subunit delta'